MKKKMDFATKAKLIYSGELLIFAIVFYVIAILKITNVFVFNQTRATIFNWITIFGGTWIIVDLIWALVDKKRQKRVAIIDKIIHVPAGIYLICFDLFCLITKPEEPMVYQYGISSVLLYLGLCYTFEAIFHFKYPVPGIIDAVEQEKVVAEQNAEVIDAEPLAVEQQPIEENSSKEQNSSSLEEREENNDEQKN